MERDGISREMARNILSAQLPLAEKNTYADYLVDNSGSVEATKKQVLSVWEKIKEYQQERKI